MWELGFADDAAESMNGSLLFVMRYTIHGLP